MQIGALMICETRYAQALTRLWEWNVTCSGTYALFTRSFLVEITSAAVTVLDPLDGPEPRRYGVEAFALAWEVAGREALVIEAAPRTP
jgi:hypothetical protein